MHIPLSFTYSPIRSATAGSRPFSSVISRRTSDHGDLSSLSTALEIVRILSAGTPHNEKMPSSSLRWLSCFRKQSNGSVSTSDDIGSSNATTYLDCETFHSKRVEGLAQDAQHFCIRDHRIIDTRNIKVLGEGSIRCFPMSVYGTVVARMRASRSRCVRVRGPATVVEATRRLTHW